MTNRSTLLILAALLFIAGSVTSSLAQDSRPASELSREASRADDAPLQVGILTLQGVYNSELAAPYDIFQHTIFHTQPGMRVFTVGREAGLITTFEGLKVGVDYTLEDSPRIDVLVVPSAEHNMDADLEDIRLIDWVRAVGSKADYLVSVCDGAFVLAKAGLLDGLKCTTFPSDIAALRKMFPDLDVLEGPTWVADGKAFTGVGGALSYDPPLALVAHIYGDDVAARVSPGLVLKWEELHLTDDAHFNVSRRGVPRRRVGESGFENEDSRVPWNGRFDRTTRIARSSNHGRRGGRRVAWHPATGPFTINHEL